MSPLLSTFAGASSLAYGFTRGSSVVDAFELIGTTLVSSATSSVTFSSIPSTYQFLELRITARSSFGSTMDELLIRFNGDTAANYGHSQLRYDAFSPSGSASQTAQTGIRLYSITANTAAANTFGSAKLQISGYQNTNMKTSIRGIVSGSEFTSSFNTSASLGAGMWNNTASVTSLTISSFNSANIAANSRLSLYGIT